MQKIKKKTYVVRMDTAVDYDLCYRADKTPYVVETVNGQPACQYLRDFPNPDAHAIYAIAGLLKEIMGDRLAHTVIEYLDKKTGAPVAYVFPTYEHLVRPDAMKRMNHLSRRDFEYECELRRNLVIKWLKPLRMRIKKRRYDDIVSQPDAVQPVPTHVDAWNNMTRYGIMLSEKYCRVFTLGH